MSTDSFLVPWDDQSNLDEEKWLNGAVIGMAVSILKTYYPSCGLQDPSVVTYGGFQKRAFLNAYVQIHHDGESHWFVTGLYQNKVYLMDSLQSKNRISDQFKRQIQDLYGAGRNHPVRLQILPVQQQDGDIDCGLFAVYYAGKFMELAAKNLSSSEFEVELIYNQVEQYKMRKYFRNGLSTKDLRQFLELKGPERSRLVYFIFPPCNDKY